MSSEPRRLDPDSATYKRLLRSGRIPAGADVTFRPLPSGGSIQTGPDGTIYHNHDGRSDAVGHLTDPGMDEILRQAAAARRGDLDLRLREAAHALQPQAGDPLPLENIPDTRVLWASLPCTSRSVLPEEAKEFKENRWTAKADPIAKEWARLHLEAQRLAAKIEADVEEGLRLLKAIPRTPAYQQQETTLRGTHPDLDAWAKTAQNEAEAETVLLAIWPILCDRDDHPPTIQVAEGVVRLIRAPGRRPEVRFERVGAHEDDRLAATDSDHPTPQQEPPTP